jgi:MFS family permease
MLGRGRNQPLLLQPRQSITMALLELPDMPEQFAAPEPLTHLVGVERLASQQTEQGVLEPVRWCGRLAAITCGGVLPGISLAAPSKINKMNIKVDFIQLTCYKLLTREGGCMTSEIVANQPARRAPLYALYTSNIVSAVGDVLMVLAIPWFVLQTTGSVVQTGLAAFFSTAAVAMSALLGAHIVERLGFRRASVVSDLASAASVALIPLFYETVGLPFWVLLLLVFLAGLLMTPGATARSSMVPELAALAHMRIERAAATSDGMTRLSRFIGAPLAGLLIVFIGPGNLLWIDAATFAFSALVIGRAVPVILLPPPVELSTATNKPAATSGGFLRGLREGIAFIWHDPVLFWPTLVVLVTNLLDAGASGVLYPVFVKQTYGSPVWLGAMVATFGGAAFLGTLVFGAIGHRLPRQLTLGLCFTLGGAVRYFLTVGFAPHPFVLVALLTLCGLLIGAINPIFDTVAYERVPAGLRARVFGVLTAGAMLGSPLGGLIAGAIVPGIGIAVSLLIFGAVYTVATISLLIIPSLRDMDKPRSATARAVA